MYMRSLLTGAALLSLVALPAYAAGQTSPAAVKPAAAVTSTTSSSIAKPAPVTEATKTAKPLGEKVVAKTGVRKHRVVMHEARRMHKVAKAAVKSGTQTAKVESPTPKAETLSAKGGK